MSEFPHDAAVVGHLCLDIIPAFPPSGTSLYRLLVPGKLLDVGAAVLSTGGAASNTGLALHRLGFTVDIVGKVGDDPFGETVRKLLARHGPGLARNMIVSPGEDSSYSIVISPPGIDRIFFHSSGANDTFRASDVPDQVLDGTRLLHFGYPPLMRRFYEKDGQELVALLGRARERGVTTSLDMSRPDPDGPAGRIDWIRLLRAVLPLVDVFLPSLDEIVFMMDRPLFGVLEGKAAGGNMASVVEPGYLSALADRLLLMGPAVVGFKLGDQGLYLKSTGSLDRLAAMGRAAHPGMAAWAGAEYLAPCRKVQVASATGSGDCTIAGFLGALLRGMPPDEAAAMAVAVGAASVESRGATDGIPRWEEVRSRMEEGWPLAESVLITPEWRKTGTGCYRRK